MQFKKTITRESGEVLKITIETSSMECLGFDEPPKFYLDLKVKIKGRYRSPYDKEAFSMIQDVDKRRKYCMDMVCKYLSENELQSLKKEFLRFLATNAVFVATPPPQPLETETDDAE